MRHNLQLCLRKTQFRLTDGDLPVFSGINRYNPVLNNNTRDRCDVASITEQMLQKRLRRNGLISCGDHNFSAKICLSIQNSENRPKRQMKQHWRTGDLKTSQLHPNQAPDPQDLANLNPTSSPSTK